MAEIVDLAAERGQRVHARAHEPAHGPAHILLYTGIRYQRVEEPKPPKPKKRKTKKPKSKH